MKTTAFILVSGSSPQTENCARVLRFFGVDHGLVSPMELLAWNGTANATGPGAGVKHRILCSSDGFGQLVAKLERNADGIAQWKEHVHSVFVYAGSDFRSLQAVARALTRDAEVRVEQTANRSAELMVSAREDDFCGVMSGVRIATASESDVSSSFVIRTANPAVTSIISAGSGATFLKADYEKVPVFLSMSDNILDLNAGLPTGIFDIREHASSALPIVLYVKWAFPGICWSPTDANACLIIDDPLLRPTHGFLNFPELLSLMKRYNFATNIAFIPWNRRRSAPATVQLFKANPQLYSLSVHGCDHVRGEFGGSDQQRLYWKSRQAIDRMTEHQSKTEIPYDKVMIFPQGVFSKAAISALRRTDFMAAINNDTISVGPDRDEITAADFWDVAVMKYEGFPVFTRRNPWEGIENFAFDILLGKPALIVIHHEYCSDRCERLLALIDRLNGLKCSLVWRSLSEVVRRASRQRELSATSLEVEMYGKELLLENRSSGGMRYMVRRRESEPRDIKSIRAGQCDLEWSVARGFLTFEVPLKPGEKALVRITYTEPAANGAHPEPISYQTKAMLRRYLCEMRDNYFVTGRHSLSKFFNGARSNHNHRAVSLS